LVIRIEVVVTVVLSLRLEPLVTLTGEVTGLRFTTGSVAVPEKIPGMVE